MIGVRSDGGAMGAAVIGIEEASDSWKGWGWFLGFLGARTGAVMSVTLLISPSLKFGYLSIRGRILLPSRV
jgi:hypothetical protein